MREWLWKVASTLALYNVLPADQPGRGGLGRRSLVRRARVPARGCSGRPTGRRCLTARRSAPTPSASSGAPCSRASRWNRRHLLRLAQDTFLAADAAASYTGDWWEAGGAPLITLSTDQDMTREQMDAMRERWVELRPSVARCRRSSPAASRPRRSGRTSERQRPTVRWRTWAPSIARYFGVPPAMVNVRSAYGSHDLLDHRGPGDHVRAATPWSPTRARSGTRCRTTCPGTTRWGGGSASTSRTSRAPSRARGSLPTRARSVPVGSPRKRLARQRATPCSGARQSRRARRWRWRQNPKLRYRHDPDH